MLDLIQSVAWEYRYVIVVAISIIVFAILEQTKFKGTAYAIMLQAKSLAKDEILSSGKEQEDWVVEKLYIFLPKRVTIFISNENMHKIVHALFTKAKDYLDDKKFNRSVE